MTKSIKIAALFFVAYVFAMFWLSATWYNSYTTFHFFDDLFEWEYLDKVGHFFTSFYLGVVAYKTLGDYQNLNSSAQKKWLCFAGFILLFPIEILDGFSVNYGASVFDLAAYLL